MRIVGEPRGTGDVATAVAGAVEGKKSTTRSRTHCPAEPNPLLEGERRAESATAPLAGPAGTVYARAAMYPSTMVSRSAGVGGRQVLFTAS